MASTNLRRIPEGADRPWAKDLNTVIDIIIGNIGGRANLVGHDGTETDPYTNAVTSTTQHQLYVRSAAGLHGRFRKSDDSADIGLFDDAGATIPTLRGDTVSNGKITATQVTATVATGTTPLVISSTTEVANLNVALHQGRGVGTGVGNVAFYDASNRVVDSQKLDGIDSPSFARVDAATNFTTVPTIESDAIAKIVTGSYAGNSTGGHAITGLGFSPKIVFVVDPGATNSGFFNIGNQAIISVSGGATGNVATNLDADGFTLNGAGLNITGHTYYYVALG